MKGFKLTFILAHYVTPLKWGWVHSISLVVSTPSSEAVGDSIRVRRCAPGSGGRAWLEEVG
jgi:hypothetical protein